MLQGTLDLMILKTLHALGPLHGFGIARRIEQVSRDVLQLNEGTVYTSLLRLQQQGWIAAEWGTSENNRKAKFYSITERGRKQLEVETENWERISGVIRPRAAAGSGEIVMTLTTRCHGCARSRRSCAVFCADSSPDDEFDDEIQEHLRLLAERFVAQGMSREEAAAAARRQFGNTTLLQEDRRELQTLPSIEAWWHDLRYALRMLWKARDSPRCRSPRWDWASARRPRSSA